MAEPSPAQQPGAGEIMCGPLCGGAEASALVATGWQRSHMRTGIDHDIARLYAAGLGVAVDVAFLWPRVRRRTT